MLIVVLVIGFELKLIAFDWNDWNDFRMTCFALSLGGLLAFVRVAWNKSKSSCDRQKK
jgi:hypothetical protein